jgi:hypothetical protein
VTFDSSEPAFVIKEVMFVNKLQWEYMCQKIIIFAIKSVFNIDNIDEDVCKVFASVEAKREEILA